MAMSCVLAALVASTACLCSGAMDISRTPTWLTSGSSRPIPHSYLAIRWCPLWPLTASVPTTSRPFICTPFLWWSAGPSSWTSRASFSGTLRSIRSTCIASARLRRSWKRAEFWWSPLALVLAFIARTACRACPIWLLDSSRMFALFCSRLLARCEYLTKSRI